MVLLWSLLLNSVGVNLETERLYLYNVNGSGKWSLDTKSKVEIPHHVLRDGMAFETEDTPQWLLSHLNKKHTTRSGIIFFSRVSRVSREGVTCFLLKFSLPLNSTTLFTSLLLNLTYLASTPLNSTPPYSLVTHHST